MLQDVSDAAKEVGLQLHPDKTKILPNSVGSGVGAKAAEIRNMTIEILDKTQKAMYIARMLKPTDNDLWEWILGVDRANVHRHQYAATKDASMYCQVPQVLSKEPA